MHVPGPPRRSEGLHTGARWGRRRSAGERAGADLLEGVSDHLVVCHDVWGEVKLDELLVRGVADSAHPRGNINDLCIAVDEDDIVELAVAPKHPLLVHESHSAGHLAHPLDELRQVAVGAVAPSLGGLQLALDDVHNRRREGHGRENLAHPARLFVDDEVTVDWAKPWWLLGDVQRHHNPHRRLIALPHELQERPHRKNLLCEALVPCRSSPRIHDAEDDILGPASGIGAVNACKGALPEGFRIRLELPLVRVLFPEKFVETILVEPAKFHHTAWLPTFSSRPACFLSTASLLFTGEKCRAWLF